MPHDTALILIAEDDPMIASLLRELLTDEGYDTVCCHSGAEALRAVDAELPDLVIVDLQMEYPDAGLIVAQRLRRDPATARLPVILYSASGPMLNELAPVIARLGCRTMAKPFEIDHMLALIDALLSRPAARIYSVPPQSRWAAPRAP